MNINKINMTFDVTAPKVSKSKRMSSYLLKTITLCWRYVNARILRSFFGMCISVRLEMTWVRYYARSLYDAL